MRSPRTTFVYHRKYEESPSGLPIDLTRGSRILAFLEREGLIGGEEVRQPHAVSLALARKVHDDAYLESLHDPAVLSAILGSPLPPGDVDMVLDLHRLMAGGTISAAEQALRSGGIAVNLGGGFHHARKDQGRGFCVLNDLALAIARLREIGFFGRALIVDLDVHDGDGTRLLFAEDPTVHTFSIHSRSWSDAPAVESTVIELGPRTTNGIYLSHLRSRLPPVIARFRPEIVFYLAGNDVAEDDRIGDMSLSAEGILARDRFVLDSARGGPDPLPLVIMLAGGYGQDAWRYSARFFSCLWGGGPIEPPRTDEMTLRMLRREGRGIDPSDLMGSQDLELSADDIFGPGGLAPHRRRLLDYYTRTGLEIALERYGVLSRLRALGFSQPTLDFDLGSAAGDLLRIFGDPEKRELLIEVRLRKDRALVPGFSILSVEWLLLQNPRLPFSSERPALPGQAHPGLGLLSEAVGLFVLMAERLELDGVSFTPGYYHLAYQARGNLAFVDPGDEGRFRAMRRAVAHLPLKEASWALAEGRLVDRATGASVSWRPRPMVLALSDRLKTAAFGGAWEERASETARGLLFELAEPTAAQK
ncbi:MAG: histone deacetylase [Myxococcota bacterium]